MLKCNSFANMRMQWVMDLYTFNIEYLFYFRIIKKHLTFECIYLNN